MKSVLSETPEILGFSLAPSDSCYFLANRGEDWVIGVYLPKTISIPKGGKKGNYENLVCNSCIIV